MITQRSTERQSPPRPAASEDGSGRQAQRVLQLLRLETWILLSGLLFVACVLFPPKWYARLIGEPNYLFLHLPTILYTAAAIACFWFGAWLIDDRRRGLYRPRWPAAPQRLHTTDLVLGTTFVLIQTALAVELWRRGAWAHFLHGTTSVSLADEIGLFEGLPACGLVLGAVPVYLGWWLWLHLHSGRKGITTWIFVALLVTFVLVAVPIGKRNFLTRPAFAMLLIYILYRVRLRTIVPRRMLTGLAAAALSMAMLFVLFQSLRNRSTDVEQLAGDTVRYVVGPYNTQAMLLSGTMDYPGSGTGFYWTQWLWNFPLVKDLLPLEEWRLNWFGPPPPFGAGERIKVVQHYGVQKGTALSAFGNSFVDFGIFGVLPFALTGALGGWFWRRFQVGDFFGLCFYPIVAYSVVEWRANLLFPAPYLGFVLVLVVVVGLGHWLEKTLIARRLFEAQGQPTA